MAKQEHSDWRNRIVVHGAKPASQFMANSKNWRVHPQAQRDALHGALNEIGWVAPVVENVRTGYLVDGHERVWQALQNGDAEVPYVEVELDAAEEAYVLATLDPISAMAQASREQLGALLAEVQSGEAGVQAMLAEVASAAGLWADAPVGDTSTDRDGQGVASTWQQVKGAEMARVVLGDVEIRLELVVMQKVLDALEKAFASDGTPYAETMSAILIAGSDSLD